LDAFAVIDLSHETLQYGHFVRLFTHPTGGGREGSVETTRWDRLFADLEVAAAGLTEADDEAEIAERTRIEYGSVELMARLHAAIGCPATIVVTHGEPVVGRLRGHGSGWIRMDSDYAQTVIATAAVVAVRGIESQQAAPEESISHVAVSLRQVLRAIARDRSRVTVRVAAGSSREESLELSGTIDVVARDFVELAEHPAEEFRRASAVSSVALVPLGGLVSVRTRSK
jgi:hypothetical protein